MSKVTVKDQGANDLLKRARELAKGKRVAVGILDDAPKQAEPGEKAPKLSLVEIAIIHEFGAPAAGIPQRSFIRATIDENKAEIIALERSVAAKIIAGEIEPERGLSLIGAKVASMMQAKIADGIEPALKPETIARKGSSKPLVNTGQLRSAITWALREGSA